MITSAGLMSPIVETLHVTPNMLALMVIAIASGATILSHVNDSGFWLVNRYFSLSEKDTLRSWTVMETLIAFTGFAAVFVLALFYKKTYTEMKLKTRIGANDKPLEISALVAYAGPRTIVLPGIVLLKMPPIRFRRLNAAASTCL